MNWSDPKTVDVIAGYVRIVVGVLFAVVVLYLFASEKIDVTAALRAIGALLFVDRMGIGIHSLIKSRNGSDSG